MLFSVKERLPESEGGITKNNILLCKWLIEQELTSSFTQISCVVKSSFYQPRLLAKVKLYRTR